MDLMKLPPPPKKKERKKLPRLQHRGTKEVELIKEMLRDMKYRICLIRVPE